MGRRQRAVGAKETSLARVYTPLMFILGMNKHALDTHE